MKSKIILLSASVLVSFFAGELICKKTIGTRLIPHQEKNGLYYFQPNQYGWYLLGHPSARINNIGARGEDVAIDKIRRKKKFIFLGDSFTFGWMLSDWETIPHLFMKTMRLTPEEVLNYGNGGFGVDHMKEIYRHRSTLFAPGDVLIVILFKPDFDRTLEPYKKNILKEVFWGIRSKSSLISWAYVVLRNAALRTIPPSPEETPAQAKGLRTLEFFEKPLLDFSDIAGKNGQKIIFVFHEFIRSDYSKMAEKICAKNHWMCLTNVWRLASEVEKRGEVLYAPDQAHPSYPLNREVGEAIARLVKTNLRTESLPDDSR